MDGQAKRVVAMHYVVETTAGGTPARVESLVEASTSALTDAATDAVATSAAGNIYGRVSGVSNLDSGTAGYIIIDLLFEPK